MNVACQAPVELRPYEVDARIRNAMASRLLRLRLERLHYEHAPKEIKDKHLPVLWVCPAKKQKKKAAPDFSRDGFDPEPARPVHTVLAAVSHYYRMAQHQILGRNQSASFVKPRHVAMYLASEFSDMSIAQLGRFFKRDHTVILHARKSIFEKMEYDATLRLQVNTLRRQIAAMANIPPVDHVARMREMASKHNPRNKRAGR